MGIRDHLRPHVTPYDAQQGWKVGDTGIVTTVACDFYRFTVPEGASVTIDGIPEARHGADPYALGSFTWEGHEGCEAALSPETAKHHFGTNTPHVRRS